MLHCVASSCRIFVSHLRVTSSSSIVVSRPFAPSCLNVSHCVDAHYPLASSSCIFLLRFASEYCFGLQLLASSYFFLPSFGVFFSVCDVYDARFCLASSPIALFCFASVCCFCFFVYLTKTTEKTLKPQFGIHTPTKTSLTLCLYPQLTTELISNHTSLKT